MTQKAKVLAVTLNYDPGAKNNLGDFNIIDFAVLDTFNKAEFKLNMRATPQIFERTSGEKIIPANLGGGRVFRGDVDAANVKVLPAFKVEKNIIHSKPNSEAFNTISTLKLLVFDNDPIVTSVSEIAQMSFSKTFYVSVGDSNLFEIPDNVDYRCFLKTSVQPDDVPKGSYSVKLYFGAGVDKAEFLQQTGFLHKGLLHKLFDISDGNVPVGDSAIQSYLTENFSPIPLAGEKFSISPPTSGSRETVPGGVDAGTTSGAQ